MTYNNIFAAISALEFLIAFGNCFFTQRRRERRVRVIKSSILSTFCLRLAFTKRYFCHGNVKVETADIFVKKSYKLEQLVLILIRFNLRLTKASAKSAFSRHNLCKLIDKANAGFRGFLLFQKLHRLFQAFNPFVLRFNNCLLLLYCFGQNGNKVAVINAQTLGRFADHCIVFASRPFCI